MRETLKNVWQQVWCAMKRFWHWIVLIIVLLSAALWAWPEVVSVCRVVYSSFKNPEHYSRWDIFTKLVAGVLVCVGFMLTWMRIRVSDRQAKAAQHQAESAMQQVQAIEGGQVTERFTKAIEQLGSGTRAEPNPEIRLGGIYALEHIARDSNKFHWTV